MARLLKVETTILNPSCESSPYSVSGIWLPDPSGLQRPRVRRAVAAVGHELRDVLGHERADGESNFPIELVAMLLGRRDTSDYFTHRRSDRRRIDPDADDSPGASPVQLASTQVGAMAAQPVYPGLELPNRGGGFALSQRRSPCHACPLPREPASTRA